jgi:hypothetical protein
MVDWQTVVVTAAALVAAFVLVRPLLGPRDAGASCPSCAAGRSCASRSPVVAMQPPAGTDRASR